MSHTLPEGTPSSGLQTAREHLEIVNTLKKGDTALLAHAHALHFQGIHKRVLDRGAAQHDTDKESMLNRV